MKSFASLSLFGLLTALVLAALPSHSQVTFSNPAFITINDSTNTPTKATPYPSPLPVAGMPGLITGISVTLSNVNHSFPGDIEVLLVGPNGQSALLMANAGTTLDVTNVTITFSDFASKPLPKTEQIVSGSYNPTYYNLALPSWPPPAPSGPYPTNLSVFHGTAANGTWNLFVADDSRVDGGNISQGWSLTLVTAANVPPMLSDVTITPSLPENGIATLTGKIADPNSGGFVLSVNWGDGFTNQNASLPAGTTNFLLTHTYPDDGQPVESTENYPTTVTLTDRGGIDDDGFLSALFQDTLERPYDSLQGAYFRNLIAQSGRENFAYLLHQSYEYRAKKTQDYFRKFLHREATQGETDWLAFGAQTEREMVLVLIGSNDYFQKRAGNDNNAWLDAVYFDLLKRPITPTERVANLQIIALSSRMAAANVLILSAEYRQHLVDVWFQKFLQRAASPDGSIYVTALSSQSWERVASQILASQEYYNLRGGGADFAALNLVVTNVPPGLLGVYFAPTILEGGITSFSGQFVDPGTNDTHTLSVDWGDGSPVETVVLPTGTRSFNVPHLYSVPHKTNLVQLSLTDDDSGKVSVSTVVVVNERPPQIIAILRQAGSVTRLDCQGVPSRNYTLQVSTNVSSTTNWQNLGTISATGNGTFKGYDMPPPSETQRFYRLRSP
ncbi:MAG TPA: proprotein convertase P-domain-containing protein [Verrucomicrobiae bacterium]|nr:proprotein convertase P-domain-containing protein [Verrucomicrobiae bacterium]